MDELALTSESVSYAAWFAAFSVIAIAAAIIVSATVWFIRRKKYIRAVENRHKIEQSGAARLDKMPVTHHVMNPFQIILVGFFVASVVMFMPYCYYANAFGSGNWGKAFMAALHGTLRTFVLDGEYDIVAGFTSELVKLDTTVGWFYIVWSWLIYVFAPIFATGIVLTLFKNTLSYFRYRTAFFVKHICLMSELNEKSLALAEDIVIRDRDERGKLARLFSRLVIVFADVFEKNEEENYELVAKARSLGARCVKRDVTEISLRFAKSPILRVPRTRKIYLIGENEEENVDQGLKLIDHCAKTFRYNNSNTEIYIFSCGAESATLIDTAIAAVPDNAAGNMKVRRVDDNYNLILKFLWDNSIFDLANPVSAPAAPNATTAPETESATPPASSAHGETVTGSEKLLHVVIVGLGGYGMDILRTLCWFTQVPGYRFIADVFDGEDGSEKFKHIAPELYAKNRCVKDGEPYYSIEFHDNIMAGSARFDKEISALDDVSVVFCTLGDDEENIACSMDLRMLFGRNAVYKNGCPKIYTVVYAPQLSRKLTDRHRNDFGIYFIGRIYDRFTVDVIEQTTLDAYGKAINLEYAINSTVWDFIEKTDAGNPAFGKLVPAVSKADADILALFRDESLTAAEIAARVSEIRDGYEQAVGEIDADLEQATGESISNNAASYKFEYNRRSSIARALAVRWIVKLFCNGQGQAPYNDAIKTLVARDGENAAVYSEIDAKLAKNEHNRWSAYTRSIGYVLGPRDDIRKTHNTLVPFDELPAGNQLKDRPIGALSRYLALKTASSAQKTTEDE